MTKESAKSSSEAASGTLKFKFTQARLAGVKVPAGKDRVYAFDSDCPGLAFVRTAGGSSSFYFYKKIHGRKVRYPVASGQVNIDDARDLVRRELTEYAKGNDQQVRRRQEKQQLTLLELVVAWRTVEGGKIRSAGAYEDLITRHAEPLHNRKINSIEQHEIAELHAAVGRKKVAKPAASAGGKRERDTGGAFVANRLLASLSVVFNFARKYGIENPCRGVKRFPEHARERFLQPDELARFFDAVENEPDPTWKDYWRLLFHTGARRDNVAGMAWADVDLVARVWRIPARSAKGKRMITVPLSDAALDVLRERRRVLQSETWVFPSWSKSGRLVEPKAAWDKLLARAKITDLRIHDIRRTRGSYMAMSGASDRLIGGALGQTTAQATNVYARLRSEPVRLAMDAGLMYLEAAKASAKLQELARTINGRMNAGGVAAVELAAAAGVPLETLTGLLNASALPDPATVAKLDAALTNLGAAVLGEGTSATRLGTSKTRGRKRKV